MFTRKSLIPFAMIASAIVSGDVLAHTSFAAKDWYITKDGRSYIEGSSTKLSLNVAHACPVPTGVTPAPLGWGTVITSVVFPNGADPEVYDLSLDPKTLAVLSKKASTVNLANVLYTKDANGNMFAGNALMSTKPERDGDWLEILPKTGPVPAFNSATNTRDVRSIHWHGGKVPNELYEYIEFRTSFPKFKPESCATKVRVYMPAVQYCSDNLNFTAMPDVKITADDPWLWETIPGVFDHVAAPGYAAYIDIDRNFEDNPLPKSCKSTGKAKGDDDHKNRASVADNVIGIYPNVADIEHFLKHTGNNAGGGSDTGGNGTISIPKTDSCPANYHSMGEDPSNTSNQICMPN
jgi:hypothetical protein